MTTLPDRPGTALLVIDVQTGVVAEAYERDAVVGRIAGLVDRARQQATPVIWIQHEAEDLPRDSDAWKIAPELVPHATEPVVAKRYGDAFEETILEEELARLGIGSLIVTGAATDFCVRSTLHGALARGYDALLVSDAHTTSDATEWGSIPPDKVIQHTNLYWSYQEVPGRTAGTAASDDVKFGERD
jgi:nicotinamidase-related amidase